VGNVICNRLISLRVSYSSQVVLASGQCVCVCSRKIWHHLVEWCWRWPITRFTVYRTWLLQCCLCHAPTPATLRTSFCLYYNLISLHCCRRLASVSVMCPALWLSRLTGSSLALRTVFQHVTPHRQLHYLWNYQSNQNCSIRLGLSVKLCGWSTISLKQILHGFLRIIFHTDSQYGGRGFTWCCDMP